MFMSSREEQLHLDGHFPNPLTVKACVVGVTEDANGRPYIDADLFELNENIYDGQGRLADKVKVYCNSKESLGRQRSIVESIAPGTVITVRTQQPSHKYGETAMCTLLNMSPITAPVKTAEVVKESKVSAAFKCENEPTQTFSVANIPSSVVLDADALLARFGVTRKFFLKKCLEKLLNGDFDADFT